MICIPSFFGKSLVLGAEEASLCDAEIWIYDESSVGLLGAAASGGEFGCNVLAETADSMTLRIGKTRSTDPGDMDASPGDVAADGEGDGILWKSSKGC